MSYVKIFAFLTFFVWIEHLSAQSWLISHSPVQNALAIERSTNISIKFSQPAKQSSLTNDNIKIYGSQSGLHVGAFAYDVQTQTLFIDPSADFFYGETVYVTLTTRVQLADGTPLAQPYMWNFVISVTDAGEGIFGRTAYFDSGDIPQDVVTGDFNTDNAVDLAVANAGDNTISIYKNSGSGNFELTQTIAVQSYPRALVVADFDGDHDLDLATANMNSNSVSILLNDGNGGFSKHTDIPVPESPEALTSGDFNGDGLVDLAITSWSTNIITILKNEKAGNFSTLSELQVGSQHTTINSGDVDNDGDLDLVLGDYGGSLFVLKNNGFGTFALSWQLRFGTQLKGLNVGDIDGDGDVDMIIASRDEWFVFKNDGTGRLSIEQSVSFVDPADLAISDLEGDGDLDLASFDGSAMDLYKNNGSGRFTRLSSDGAIWAPHAAASGDFNGDGDIDFAVVHGYRDKVSITMNKYGTPNISLSKTTIDFGMVNIDSTVEDSFIIWSTGDGNLQINDIVSSNPSFTVSPRSAELGAAGDGRSISVKFTPSGEVTYNDSLIIYSDAPSSSPHRVNITGSGRPTLPFEISKNSVDFGYVLVNDVAEDSINITNIGEDIKISNIITSNSDFSVEPLSGTIKNGQQLVINISFAPSGNRVYSDSLLFKSENSSLEDYVVYLYGTSILPTSVGESEQGSLPQHFNLKQNYPNPFNPSTRIDFAIARAGTVDLSIYDLRGRKVATVVHEKKSPGSYSVEYNAAELASGIYFYRLKAGNFSQVKKFLFIK